MDPMRQSDRPKRGAPDLPVANSFFHKNRFHIAAGSLLLVVVEFALIYNGRQATAAFEAEFQNTATQLTKRLESNDPRAIHARTMEVTTPHERVAFCQLPDGAKKATCAELNPFNHIDRRDLTAEATTELKDTLAQLKKRLEADASKAVPAVILEATTSFGMVVGCKREASQYRAKEITCAGQKLWM